MAKEKIVSKNFVLAFGSLFFSAIIMYMLISAVTEYAIDLGASTSASGLVSGIYVIAGLISRFYSSKMLRYLGWRKMIILSQIAQLITCSLYLIASSLPLLIATRFLHGLAFGFSASAVLTAGMATLPKSRYAEGNGYLMTSTTLAISVGPFAGGVLYDVFGAQGCFMAAISFSVCMFLAIASVDCTALGFVGDSSRSEAKGIRAFIEPASVPISSCILLSALGYSCILSFLRLYAAEQALLHMVPAFFVVYAIVLVISRPLAGKAQDKCGDSIVIYPSIVFQVFSFILIAWNPTAVTLILAAACCALGYGTLSSCANALACSKAAPERCSYAVATYWICCDTGMGAGPALLGMIETAYNYSTMFYCASFIAALVFPLYRLTQLKKQN